MTTETDFSLTPDQLAFIRAAAARWRMDKAGPMMLEALRKAEVSLDRIRTWLTSAEAREKHSDWQMTLSCSGALQSVRAAIAEAE